MEISTLKLTLACFFSFFVLEKVSAQGKPTDIFLLIGQSNMAGTSPLGELDTMTLQNVYLFNADNDWEKAKNTLTDGINRYSTVKSKANSQLSLGYNFAKKLAAYSGRNIGIVSNARGGTKIAWWQKGYTGENDFDLYEQAVIRMKAALIATPGAKLKGIIWHQGEGDNSKTGSQLYMQALKQLVGDLRKDLGDGEIPFIAGEVGKWNNRGNGVNPVIRSISAYISNATWVSSDGLTSKDLPKNDPHFDTFSQRAFGGRYADKAAALIYGLKPQGVTLFNHANLEGRSVLLGIGDYNIIELERAGLQISEILSLKIDKGYEVEFVNKEGQKLKILDDRYSMPQTDDVLVLIRKSGKK